MEKPKIYTFRKEKRGKIYKNEAEVKLKVNEELLPVYAKYKNVKVIDHCDYCSHKIGSHLEKRPVGKPTGFYKRTISPMEMIMRRLVLDEARAMAKGIEDAMSGLSNEPKPIKFRRYSPFSSDFNLKPLSEGQK